MKYFLALLLVCGTASAKSNKDAFPEVIFYQRAARGRWDPAAAVPLKVGQEVQTNAESRADVRLSSALTVRLSPSSVVQLRSLGVGAAGPEATLYLSSGRVMVRSNLQRQSAVTMFTDMAVATCQDAVFVMDLTIDDRTSIDLIDGTLLTARLKEESEDGEPIPEQPPTSLDQGERIVWFDQEPTAIPENMPPEQWDALARDARAFFDSLKTVAPEGKLTPHLGKVIDIPTESDFDSRPDTPSDEE